MLSLCEQREFLRNCCNADRRIRLGQAPTLQDRTLIHQALAMVYAMLSADTTMQGEIPDVATSKNCGKMLRMH